MQGFFSPFLEGLCLLIICIDIRELFTFPYFTPQCQEHVFRENLSAKMQLISVCWAWICIYKDISFRKEKEYIYTRQAYVEVELFTIYEMAKVCT